MRNLLAVVALLLCGCTSAIEDGLAMNGIVTVGDSFTSSFLLTTDDGALLFDVGITASGQPVIDALADVGLSASDVTDVFLSHGHGDHVGGLAAFENLDHIGMLNPRCDAGFVHEHFDEYMVLSEVGQNPLDDQNAFECVLAAFACEKDLGHATDRQPLDQLVSAHGAW